MRHVTTVQDWSREELNDMLYRARGYRRDTTGDDLAGKSVGLVTLTPGSPSPGALAYAHMAVAHLGGRLISLAGPAPDGAVLYRLGEPERDGDDMLEHVRDAAEALSAQADLVLLDAHIGPTEPGGGEVDRLVSAFAAASRVPVVVLDGSTVPCQAIAMMMAAMTRVGASDGRKFVLAWTPHPRPMGPGVANTALITAAKFGFDLRVLIPDSRYLLDNRVVDFATDEADLNMRSLSVTGDVQTGYGGADVIYAASWCASGYAGRWRDEAQLRRSVNAGRFAIDMDKVGLTNRAVVSHPGGFVRGVDIMEEVITSPDFVSHEEGANRVAALKAIIRGTLRSVA